MGSRDVRVQGVQEVKCCRGSKGAGGAKVQGQRCMGSNSSGVKWCRESRGTGSQGGQGMQGVKGCMGERGVGGQGYRGVKDARV